MRPLNNHLKTVVLLGGLSALVVGIGAALGPRYIGLFGVLAVAMNIGAYFFSDKLVLALHRAKEIPREAAPDLHGLVEELATRGGLPKPRVFLIPDEQPNAFATGRNPEKGVVAVTEGILRILTPRELRGVLAHELAHIRNRDILVSSIAATLVSVISSVANALSFAALFGGGGRDDERSPGGGLLTILVAPIAATLIQLGISRSREFLADETGARMCGDPEALASALRKLERGAAAIPSATEQTATASLFIVNPFAGAGGLLKLFSTHPSTEERVRRLLAMAPGGTRVLHPDAVFYPA